MCVAMMFGCVLAAGCGPTDEKGQSQVAGQTEDAATTDGKDQTYGEWVASHPPDSYVGPVCGPESSRHKDIPLHFIDWSPDGTHLIFDDVTSVRLVNVDGTRLRQVVDANPGYQFPNDLGMHAAFSPDGQRIVYTTCEYATEGLTEARDAPWSPRGEYQYEIATVGVDGSGAQRRTTNGYYDHLPSWSPDSGSIAFLSAGYETSRRILGELHVLSAGALHAEPEALVRDLWVAAPPQWSPDGAHVAVLGIGSEVQLGDKFADEMSVMVVTVEGPTPHAVAQTVSTVSWSPDGELLALARLRENAVQLVTIAPDGSDAQVIQRLTDRAGLAAHDDIQHSVYNVPLLHVAWSPDGAHLLYSCGHRFCVVNLDGEIVGRSPEEFAKERGRAAAAWAPDGSRIAVRAAGNPTPNGEVVLYTMAPDGTDVRVLVRGGLAMVAEHSRYQDAEVGKTACREGYVVPEPASNPGLVADCETLMGLRDTLAGPTILNWGAGPPLEQWAGVQVSGEPRRVTGLKFRLWQGVHGHESLRLIGHIPPAIGDLDQLQTLDLSGHRFFDDVPRELERLTHLRELDLRLYLGAGLSGCLSAAFVEQLDEAHGVLHICEQESTP